MQTPAARSLVLAILALASMTAACGGNVVVDGSGNAGGHGGQGGSGVSPGQVTASCNAFCDVSNASACPEPHPEQCRHDCAVSFTYAGVCAPQLEAFLACFVKLPSDQLCSSKTCEAERAEVDACERPPGNCSQTMLCTAALGGEHCEFTCGNNVYDTVCTVTPPAYKCTCKFNGATVATCTDELSSAAECCAATFATE
jgi:hypothetical protein